MSAVQDTSASPAWNRLQWSALDEAARAGALTRPVQVVAEATRQAVAAVIDAVRTRGDDALRELTARFDRVELPRFEVTAAEFAAAEVAVAPELRRAMVEAAARIEAFHRAGMSQGYRWRPRRAWSASASSGRSRGWDCTCRPAARRCPPPR